MINKLTIFQQSFLAEPKMRAIAALLTFAFVPILLRLGENEISPTAVIFHRLWIAAIPLGLHQLRSKYLANQPQVYNNQTLGLLVGGGICFGTTQLIWAWSITQTSIEGTSVGTLSLSGV
ncbi:MAG TPA: hypothetical protein DCF68_20245 [Cyanothece sp. UBA12306]|nr:hypothetical protein [Cyanothece sp. UBA12306]